MGAKLMRGIATSTFRFLFAGCVGVGWSSVVGGPLSIIACKAALFRWGVTAAGGSNVAMTAVRDVGDGGVDPWCSERFCGLLSNLV